MKNIVIVSILGCTIQYSLTYSGLNLIDAASASFLVQSEVPFGIIVAYFMLGEKTPLKNIIGIIIAFIGVFLSVSLSYITNVRQSKDEREKLRQDVLNGYGLKLFEKRMETYPILYTYITKMTKKAQKRT